MINKKLYDNLKFIAQVVLPAVGALYFALSQIWGLPDGKEVVGTITVIDAFLGAVLHINSQTYKKDNKRFDGEINITENDNKKSFLLEIPGDPDKLDKKDEVLFRVNKPTKKNQKS